MIKTGWTETEMQHFHWIVRSVIQIKGMYPPQQVPFKSESEYEVLVLQITNLIEFSGRFGPCV